ncbi:hypothetical protein LZ31DRAFT_94628 [Colletotrichum somersetense]|nr:hypothetical protein LZ31DRAFT_94628 [Colletotrichum somersetense]
MRCYPLPSTISHHPSSSTRDTHISYLPTYEPVEPPSTECLPTSQPYILRTYSTPYLPTYPILSYPHPNEATSIHLEEPQPLLIIPRTPSIKPASTPTHLQSNEKQPASGNARAASAHPVSDPVFQTTSLMRRKPSAFVPYRVDSQST